MKNRSFLSALALLGASFAAAGQNYRVDASYDFSFGTHYERFHDLEAIMAGGSVEDGGNPYGWSSATGFHGDSPTDYTLSFDTTPFYDFLGQNPARPFLEESFAFGILDGLPTDGTPQQEHLVLLMDPTAAQRVQNIAFGTIFGTSAQPYPYTEETVIDALEKLHDDSIPDDQKGDYLAIVHNFRDSVARQANVGSGGTTGTCWFGPGADFSVVTFSDGLTVGGGTSNYTITALPAPEPASFAALGVGVVALLRRRRR